MTSYSRSAQAFAKFLRATAWQRFRNKDSRISTSFGPVLINMAKCRIRGPPKMCALTHPCRNSHRPCSAIRRLVSRLESPAKVPQAAVDEQFPDHTPAASFSGQPSDGPVHAAEIFGNGDSSSDDSPPRSPEPPAHGVDKVRPLAHGTSLTSLQIESEA